MYNNSFFQDSSQRHCCKLLSMSQKIIILDFLGMSITPGYGFVTGVFGVKMCFRMTKKRD